MSHVCCLVCGVCCLVSGMWVLMSDVWCPVSSVWDMVSGLWDVWDVVSGFWCQEPGACNDVSQVVHGVTGFLCWGFGVRCEELHLTQVCRSLIHHVDFFKHSIMPKS